MNSDIFDALGMGNVDPGLLFIILTAIIFILLIIGIVNIVELCKLRKRFNIFCGGRDGKSLEKEIGSLFIENEALRDTSERNKKDIRVLYKRMETTFQKVGLVKYDAFNQMGGKLSFTLCLLDEGNNGFIINSVHGADGCYTYTKEIKKGVCEIALGDEEQTALNKAMGM